MCDSWLWLACSENPISDSLFSVDLCAPLCPLCFRFSYLVSRRMPREEARDARRALGDVERVALRVQALVGSGEAVEAAQVIGPAVAGEVLDVAPGMLEVLEESPRHRARAQP